MPGWIKWASSFFKTAEKPTLQKSKIYLSSANFPKDIATLNSYDEVYLNHFDFRKNRSKSDFEIILLALDRRYIFLNAEFTLAQIKILLERGFDLSNSTYRVYPAVKIADYKTLYHIADQKNLLGGLHGTLVDFTNEDLRNYPCYFAGKCHPASLHNAKLTQAQFDFLIQYRPLRSLNLTGIILDKIDISELIYSRKEIFSFTPFNPASGINTIFLSETSLQGAIIDIKILASLTKSNLHAWFNQPNLTVIIKHSHKDQYCYFEINVSDILSKIESQTMIRSGTPRLNNNISALDHFKNDLAEHYYLPDASNDYKKLSQAEKFLGLMRYIVNNPNALLTQHVLRIHQEVTPQVAVSLL